jgi:thioesterase domain-containing protein
MLRNYHKQAPRQSLPIKLFRATASSQPFHVVLDDDLGWRPFADALTRYDVPCDHLDLLREPHVRVVARVLDAELEGSQVEF